MNKEDRIKQFRDSMKCCFPSRLRANTVLWLDAQCGMRFPPYPVIDTLKLARKSGKFAKNNLGCIAADLGINCAGWHRAMADTKMAEQIFYYFLTELKKHGVSTLEQLSSFQQKRWKDLIKEN